MSVKLSTRIVLGFVLGLAALAFSMVGAPSKAAADTTDCPPAYICLWEGPTFGGYNHMFIPGNDTWCYHPTFEVKSARNHTGEHTMCFGSSCIGPGAEIDLNRVLEGCVT
jgi:hypothetical protein